MQSRLRPVRWKPNCEPDMASKMAHPNPNFGRFKVTCSVHTVADLTSPKSEDRYPHIYYAWGVPQEVEKCGICGAVALIEPAPKTAIEAESIAKLYDDRHSGLDGPGVPDDVDIFG
jgi:hypothetical protein